MKKALLMLSVSLATTSLCAGVPALASADEASKQYEDTPLWAVSQVAYDESEANESDASESETSVSEASVSEDSSVRTQREAYVTSLYRNVLGRVPSDAEVDYHVGEMEGGRTIEEVASVFFGSDEFSGRGFTDADAAQVIYVALLGRSASGEELTIRASHISAQGVSFVVSEVLRSPEFESHYESLSATSDAGMKGFAERLDSYLVGGNMPDTLSVAVERDATLTDAVLTVLKSDEFAARGYSKRQVAQLVAYVMVDQAFSGDQISEVAAYQENGMSENKLVDVVLKQYESGVVALATRYDIALGKVALTEPRDQDFNVSGFATRLYTCILGRDPDVAGLNVQCQALLDGSEAITIVNNYFVSEEFSNRVLSNTERVEIAYNTMLNREPEAEGLEYWTKYLDSGMTISSVVRGFSQAQEWANLCDEWGLKSGTLVLTEARDQRMEVTAFVSRLYRNVLDREPDVAGLNVQCQALLEGMPAAQLAQNFFLSEEFTSRPLSHEEIVSIAYATLLDREPDQYGLDGWTACMDAGMPLEYLVAGFADSDEFLNLCDEYALVRGWLDYDGEKMAEYTKVVSGSTGSGSTTVVQYDLTLDEMLDLNYPYVPEYLGYTRDQVRDAIDPSTVSGSAYLQFADLRQLSGLTADQINAYIATTENGRNGTMAGQGEAILSACRSAGLNEVYALSHAILETGWGTSELACGYYYDGTTPIGGVYYPAGTYYNYFGIGAYDSSPLSGGRALAIKNGWDSPAKGLAGGIAWIARNYTYASDYPQVTIYQMKWDPQRASDTKSYGYRQYATSIEWPSTIASIMSHCLSYAGLGTDSVNYILPAYR